MIALLLSRGAVIFALNHEGNTTLHLTAERGSQKMIKLLISQKVEASSVNRLDCTPLHLFTELRYGEAAKLLINERALISVINSAEHTAHNLAKEEGLKCAIKALMSIPVSRDTLCCKMNIQFMHLKSLLHKSSKFLSICCYSLPNSALGN